MLPKVIYKAFMLIHKLVGIKTSLNKVARAKAAAERKRLGLPTIKPWYTVVLYPVFECLRQSICSICCPCCIYKAKRRFLMESSYCYVRIFIDGTYENNIMKSLFAFLAGLILAFLFYVLLIYNLGVARNTAMLICIILALVLALGMAIFPAVRCVIMIMVPQFFSGQGRSVILAYLLIQITLGPSHNFSTNVLVMTESTTCGQELVKKGTEEVLAMIEKPTVGGVPSIDMPDIDSGLSGLFGEIKDVINRIISLAKVLKRGFATIRRAFVEIADGIRSAVEWLQEQVDNCNLLMGKPYATCAGICDSIIQVCLDYLYWIAAIKTECKDNGHKLKDFICAPLKVLLLFCKGLELIKKAILKHVRSGVQLLVQNIERMFYVKVNLQQDYSYTMHQSQSYDKIRKNILKEITGRLRPLDILNAFIPHVIGFVFILLLVRSIIYHQNYLRGCQYDNLYINFALHRIDERRRRLRRETILPLKKSNRVKYIQATSLRMAPMEKKRFRSRLAKWFYYIVFTGFQMSLDLGLWWVLDLIRRHFNVKVHEIVFPHNVKIVVHGGGILSDMYRSLVTSFDPVGNIGSDIALDITACLPNAHDPDWERYKIIGITLGVIFFINVTECYGLRFRHIVANCYYPGQEQLRAIWLYNRILRTKANFVKLSRRIVRRNGKARNGRPDDFTMKSYIAKEYPFLKRFLKYIGYDRKYCLVCARPGLPKDMENFEHCDNRNCKGLYCIPCFMDLNNMCTLCMNPIDYGDYSGISEEYDSSDLDVPAKRREATLARKRKKKIERRELYEHILSSSDDESSLSESELSNHEYQFEMGESYVFSESDTSSSEDDKLAVEVLADELAAMSTSSSNASSSSGLSDSDIDLLKREGYGAPFVIPQEPTGIVIDRGGH